MWLFWLLTSPSSTLSPGGCTLGLGLLVLWTLLAPGWIGDDSVGAVVRPAGGGALVVVLPPEARLARGERHPRAHGAPCDDEPDDAESVRLSRGSVSPRPGTRTHYSTWRGLGLRRTLCSAASPMKNCLCCSNHWMLFHQQLKWVKVKVKLKIKLKVTAGNRHGNNDLQCVLLYTVISLKANMVPNFHD